MNEITEKYEYLLKTWGGFYNKEHQDIHGFEEGYFWFDTQEERKEYIDKLKKTEEELKALYVMTVLSEGYFTRYKTIAKVILIYKDKKYPVDYNFGFNYPERSAEFMWLDGNYSCDCNRSRFIRENYGKDSIPELNCGNEILLESIVIVKERIVGNPSYCEE